MFNDRFLLSGVMGWPVGHSQSPFIHAAFLAQTGLRGAYLPLAIPPARLEAAVRALPALGFRGCNLTLPHKEAALSFLDHLDPLAKRIGAVNCICVSQEGALEGFNYDSRGYIQALHEEMEDPLLFQGPVVVLGAGGAARAIVVGLLEEGVKEIRLLNRTFERAEALAVEMGSCVSPLAWSQRQESLRNATLVINTTNQGMKGYPPLDLSLEVLEAHAVVSDLIYTPLETPLLTQARRKGCRIHNGLGMLLHQARFSFHHWFNVWPCLTPELRQQVQARIG